MVPNGWQEDVLINVLDKIIDYRGQSVPKAESGIPLITARNVRFGYLDFGSEEFIDESQFEKWSTRGTPKKGDILFTTEAPLGMACRFPESGTYGVGQRTVTLRTNPKLSSEFLLYFLLSERGQRLIDIRSSGSTAKGIKSSELKKVKILHPVCVDEQRKIAKILSTWDKAISTTERLIDNSKQQKKALMQQLLTGAHTQRKRLLDDSGKPFKGEWVIKKLSDLFTFSTASSKSKFIDNEGENYILDMGSVSISGKLIPTKKTKISKDFLSKGQLVMPKDDIGGGQIIGRVGYVDSPEKYVLSDHVYCLTPKSDCSLFLSYLINHHDVNKGLRRRANGTAQLGLGKKDAEKQPVFMPKDITEQQKIASVLTNADQEIELLEQQLADLKQEKKALMQQLLTGKRRVKVDDKEVA